MKLIKTFEGFLDDNDMPMIPTRDTDAMPAQGPAGEIDHEGHHEALNYMFFGNLETIKRCIDTLLEMDPVKVDQILKDGHNWAVDHIVSSKDDVEEVYNFLVNEMTEPDRADEGKSYMCKECSSTYLEEDLNDDMTCESCGSTLEESIN